MVQVDVAFGETNYQTACVECDNQTTTWHSGGLYALQHSETTCVAGSDIDGSVFAIPNVSWFDYALHAVDRTRNISLATRRCTICSGGYLEISPCTPTSDTVCHLMVPPATILSTPAPPPCNPGYFYNSFNDINEYGALLSLSVSLSLSSD